MTRIRDFEELKIRVKDSDTLSNIKLDYLYGKLYNEPFCIEWFDHASEIWLSVLFDKNGYPVNGSIIKDGLFGVNDD